MAGMTQGLHDARLARRKFGMADSWDIDAIFSLNWKIANSCPETVAKESLNSLAREGPDIFCPSLHMPHPQSHPLAFKCPDDI